MCDSESPWNTRTYYTVHPQVEDRDAETAQAIEAVARAALKRLQEMIEDGQA